MKRAHWLGRALLIGFVCVFLFAAAHVFLESIDAWQRLPRSVTHAISLLTGAILAFELAGHLVLSAGRLPDPPRPR